MIFLLLPIYGVIWLAYYFALVSIELSVTSVLLPDSFSQYFAYQFFVITLIDVSPELRARYFASHSMSKALGNKTSLKEEAGGLEREHTVILWLQNGFAEYRILSEEFSVLQIIYKLCSSAGRYLVLVSSYIIMLYNKINDRKSNIQQYLIQTLLAAERTR